MVGIVISRLGPRRVPQDGPVAQVNAAEAEVRRVITEVLNNELPETSEEADDASEGDNKYGGLEQN
eukprot:3923516-Pyramimonas_sp.AAC.1